MHNQAFADYKVLDGAFSLEFHDHKGCVAADHWRPLNDSFQGLICRSLKTYV